MTNTHTSMTNGKKWEALLRGSLLGSIMQKNTQYIARADARAQVMITISAFLIPIAMTGVQHLEYRASAIACIATAIGTITSSIWVLFPKTYQPKHHKHHNLLHFSQVACMSEDAYMQKMQTATSNTGDLTKMVVQDFYHLSARVLSPKYFWLRVSYSIFLIGNVFAVLLAFAALGIF